jgi:hypothetical protein
MFEAWHAMLGRHKGGNLFIHFFASLWLPRISPEWIKGFFNQYGVTASKTRFIVRGQLYEINKISFLSYQRLKPNRWFAMACMAIGVLLVLDEGDLFAFSGCLILLGIVASAAAKPQYAVMLTMPEGEVQALVSTELPHVEKVIQALNTSRGMHSTESVEPVITPDKGNHFNPLTPPVME